MTRRSYAPNDPTERTNKRKPPVQYPTIGCRAIESCVVYSIRDAFPFLTSALGREVEREVARRRQVHHVLADSLDEIRRYFMFVSVRAQRVLRILHVNVVFSIVCEPNATQPQVLDVDPNGLILQMSESNLIQIGTRVPGIDKGRDNSMITTGTLAVCTRGAPWGMIADSLVPS